MLHSALTISFGIVLICFVAKSVGCFQLCSLHEEQALNTTKVLPLSKEKFNSCWQHAELSKQMGCETSAATCVSVACSNVVTSHTR